MRVDLFDFDLPERPDRAAPARAARCRAAARWSGPGRRSRTDASATCPELLRPATRSSSTTPGSSRPAHGVRVRGGDRPRASRSCCTSATSADRWRAFARPAKKLAPGDRIRFGESSDSACLLGSLDATVEAKGEGGEVDAAFDFAGADLDEAIAALGDMPLPPYIAGKRAEDDARPHRLPDRLRQRGGRRRRADRRPALHRRAASRAWTRAASRRHFVTLHVGAGTFLPVKADDTARASDACRDGARSRADDRRRPERGARRRRPHRRVGTTSLRLLESARAGEDGDSSGPFVGETRSSSRRATASGPSTC